VPKTAPLVAATILSTQAGDFDGKDNPMRWYHMVVAFVAGWVLAMTLAATPYGVILPKSLAPTIAQLQTPSMRIAFAPVLGSVASGGCGVLCPRKNRPSPYVSKGLSMACSPAFGDKYTFYQEPEKAKQTSDDMRGKTVGIGIYLRITDGKAYVWKPIAMLLPPKLAYSTMTKLSPLMRYKSRR
jgi:hypothetical protein